MSDESQAQKAANQIENLELKKETVQDLTEEAAEKEIGGAALPGGGDAELLLVPTVSIRVRCN
jgi:hypothetical protein